MQAHDSDPSKPAPQTLSATQVADRMELSTRQLQDLRLRGIGPPIVLRGLSIHYDLADVREIERHEAMAIIERLLASDRPLTLLRTMVDLAGFKPSPILQEVSGPMAYASSDPIPAPENPKPPELAQSAAPEPPHATPPALTIITSPTTAWYMVHTKPRQEDVALTNLQRQGFQCYLPKMRIERIRRRKAEVATEPMLPGYFFIRLDSSDQGKSWSPIRSTLGVSQLVHFGAQAAKVDDTPGPSHSDIIIFPEMPM